jgi:hypothetical protein
MSLFEWLGESVNRGPMGTIETGAPESPSLSRGLMLLRGVVGVAMLSAGVAAGIATGDPGPWLSLLGIYLLVSYSMRPAPDYSNVGWLGGLVDHPFRWSDDVNRILIFFLIILWPGRFAVAATRDGVRALTSST